MDLEDILLGMALSIPDITNDLLAVPDLRVNVPHPRSAVKLGSDSGLQYDTDSKDDRDPLEVLCDTVPWVHRGRRRLRYIEQLLHAVWRTLMGRNSRGHGQAVSVVIWDSSDNIVLGDFPIGQPGG